jgi:CheY-like chemotaxis protein
MPGAEEERPPSQPAGSPEPHGREAVDAVRARQPDVVILDIIMPVVDSWSALAEVRNAGISPQ